MLQCEESCAEPCETAVQTKCTHWAHHDHHTWTMHETFGIQALLPHVATRMTLVCITSDQRMRRQRRWRMSCRAVKRSEIVVEILHISLDSRRLYFYPVQNGGNWDVDRLAVTRTHLLLRGALPLRTQNRWRCPPCLHGSANTVRQSGSASHTAAPSNQMTRAFSALAHSLDSQRRDEDARFRPQLDAAVSTRKRARVQMRRTWRTQEQHSKAKAGSGWKE
jgi:hypothetical protein